jgi:hypothetical protein
MDGYINNGYVCVRRDGNEYRLEPANNQARNQFGRELDETYENVAEPIQVSEDGQPFVCK